MKLRFRLPDEDEDENEERPRPLELLDPDEISRRAIIAALGGVATQALWPLPVLYVVAFGLVGGVIGMAALLRLDKQEATLAFLVLWGAMNLFTPPAADIGFLARSFVVTLGAVGLVVTARRWILRALGEDDEAEGPGSGQRS